MYDSYSNHLLIFLLTFYFFLIYRSFSYFLHKFPLLWELLEMSSFSLRLSFLPILMSFDNPGSSFKCNQMYQLISFHSVSLSISWATMFSGVLGSWALGGQVFRHQHWSQPKPKAHNNRGDMELWVGRGLVGGESRDECHIPAGRCWGIQLPSSVYMWKGSW